jgi:hypothetical protein
VRIATLKESARRARNGLPMISSEVQRTLVKSPPELWAELSDPASLARQLGELGEIRITRVEPEETVEWEAADTTGTVLLKASGWGTKVTLTVAREFAAPELTTETELEPAVQAESVHAVEPTVGEGPATGEEPAARELDEAAAEQEPLGGPAGEAELAVGEVEELEPEAVAEEPELGRRRGFFARIFRRRRQEQVFSAPHEVGPALTVEPGPALIVEPEPAAGEETPPQDEPPQDEPPQELPDIAAELQVAEETAVEEITAQEIAAEEVAAEEVTAVLTAVLDRLGAAHHRPFSRA